MLRTFVNRTMVLTKRLNFLIQMRNEYAPQPSKLLSKILELKIQYLDLDDDVF
jgi:hypothetical protein